MNNDILHRPTALENLLAGRIWPAGRRLPMHDLEHTALIMVKVTYHKCKVLEMIYIMKFPPSKYSVNANTKHKGSRVVSASESERSVPSSTPASAIIYDSCTSIIK